MAPKVIQKTYTKIKRNFIEKLTKNDSKIGAQGGSNEPAFRSLNPSWGHPAAQRDPTVPKGRPWEAKWRPSSSKMEPKSMKHRFKILSKFQSDFGVVLGPFLRIQGLHNSPKIDQKRSKNHSKIRLNF